MNAINYIVSTILNLLIYAFLLRLLLQWVGADFYNPVSQFIVRITDPLVMPARRLIPAIGKLDTATLVVILVLQIVSISLLAFLLGSNLPSPLGMLTLVLLRTVGMLLRLYIVTIFIQVILSWVSPGPYNPFSGILSSINQPILRPIQRLLPSIGGWDLSPLFALIGLQALVIALTDFL